MAPQFPEETPHGGDLVFAYGTLKRGGQYHHLIEQIGARFIGPGQLDLARYPCLLDQPGSGLGVRGEVFRVHDPEDWKVLDQLEDHPFEYKRRVEPVWVKGERLSAWTYFYQEPDKIDPDLIPVEEFPIDPGPGSDDAV